MEHKCSLSLWKVFVIFSVYESRNYYFLLGPLGYCNLEVKYCKQGKKKEAGL